MPALLNSTSILPKRSAPAVTKASTCSRSETSSSRASSVRPLGSSVFAKAASASAWRSASTSREPSACSLRAVAAPIPEAAPVISATLPSNRCDMRELRRVGGPLSSAGAALPRARSRGSVWPSHERPHSASDRHPRRRADRADGADPARAIRARGACRGGRRARRGAGARLRRQARRTQGPRQLRRVDRRSRDRRDLQPAPQRAPLRLDAARPARRQARAVREADRIECRRSRAHGARRRGDRPRARRGVPLALPPARHAHARARALGRARRGAPRRGEHVHPAAPARRHPLPLRSRRRRHDGHGVLRDQSRAFPGRGRAERRVGGSEALLARRRSLDARRAALRGRAQRPRRVLALLGEAARR